MGPTLSEAGAHAHARRTLCGTRCGAAAHAHVPPAARPGPAWTAEAGAEVWPCCTATKWPLGHRQTRCSRDPSQEPRRPCFLPTTSLQPFQSCSLHDLTMFCFFVFCALSLVARAPRKKRAVGRPSRLCAAVCSCSVPPPSACSHVHSDAQPNRSHTRSAAPSFLDLALDSPTHADLCTPAPPVSTASSSSNSGKGQGGRVESLRCSGEQRRARR